MMLPLDPPGYDSQEEAAFEARLTQLIAELPETLLNNMRTLLAGCAQSALSVWREPGVSAAAIAQGEQLTGLTEAQVRTMSELNEPAALGRVLLAAPCRLHAVVSLGLALFSTPLLARLNDFFNHRAAMVPGAWNRIQEAAREIGANLLRNLEEGTPGPLYNVEDVRRERFDETYTAPRFTGPELRQRRLQIEAWAERTFRRWVPLFGIGGQAASQPTAPAGVAALPDPVLPPASARAPYVPPGAAFFNAPYLEMPFLAPQFAMLQLAVRLPLILHLLPEHRFGQRISQIRWLHDADRLRHLVDRLAALDPRFPVRFSLADLLVLYQGAQLVALALVGDVMQEIDAALEARAADLVAAARRQEGHALGSFFDAPPDAEGESPRRLICGMVESFVAIVRRALQTDTAPASPEREELRLAQAEIDELAGEV